MNDLNVLSSKEIYEASRARREKAKADLDLEQKKITSQIHEIRKMIIQC